MNLATLKSIIIRIQFPTVVARILFGTNSQKPVTPQSLNNIDWVSGLCGIKLSQESVNYNLGTQKYAGKAHSSYLDAGLLYTDLY